MYNQIGQEKINKKKNHSNLHLWHNVNHHKNITKGDCYDLHNNTTNNKKSKHLNFEQRKIIEQLLLYKMPKTKIAKFLHISRSTLH